MGILILVVVIPVIMIACWAGVLYLASRDPGTLPDDEGGDHHENAARTD